MVKSLQKLLLFMAILLPVIAVSQTQEDSVRRYLDEKNKLSENGMYVLGGWSVLNLGTGIYGSITTEGWSQYYHQMNAFWGGVNLIIATSAIRSIRRAEQKHPSPMQADLEWKKTKRLFLINAGLDVLYIGGGVGLMNWSENLEENATRVNAYGASVIMQGGFLLGFDLIMYYLHQRRGKKYLSPMLNRISIQGNTIRYRFG